MSNKEADILQIRKYLKGELDAKAMHQLERRAQDDPFIMDALEGYESVQFDQQANLGDLAARLTQRTGQKSARIIPFRLIGIAASVLIVCSAGVWWLSRSDNSATPAKKLVAATVQPVSPPPSPAPATATSQQMEKKRSNPSPAVRLTKPVLPAAKPELVAADKAPAPVEVKKLKNIAVNVLPDAVAKAPAIKADSTPLNELIVMNYKSTRKTDTGRFLATSKKFKNNNSNAADPYNPIQILQGKAPGVNMISNSSTPTDFNKLVIQGHLSGDLANQLLANQTLRGKVIGKDDGLPIPGASVQIAGTNKTTHTDAAGRFEIKTDSGNAKLVVANSGYETRQVSANSRDTVKSITLEPSNSSALSEVVVTGYTSQDKEVNQTAAIAAHPQKGWSSLKTYLKENAVSPDGKTGVVKLTFMVDKYGSITDIKVSSGLSKATDQKAIDMVKAGPDWVGNSDKKPEKVHLRIKFGK